MSPQLALLLLTSGYQLVASDAATTAAKRNRDCAGVGTPPSGTRRGWATNPLGHGGGGDPSALADALHHGVDTVVKFGIITDLHYADAPTEGTRYYRDSLPKARDAVRDINAAGADFMIELGDFKDMPDSSLPCAETNPASALCVNKTIGFLQEIERTAFEGFNGPRYHVLGNHDVDILTQAQALTVEKNTNDPNHPISSGNMSEGYYSFGFPFVAPVGLDTALVQQPALRFIVLNADFTDKDLPWSDLSGPNASAQGMSWEKANVPTKQLAWLASELEQARKLAQHVVVFIHYRLDGGADGPVSPPSAWVSDCTLQNAAVVRALLEKWPGLVLATFSGHDHVPHPAYTKADHEKPLYFTHHGAIEGPYSKGNNAYSVVSILSDCSIVVRGWANQANVTILGSPNCTLALTDAEQTPVVV